ILPDTPSHLTWAQAVSVVVQQIDDQRERHNALALLRKLMLSVAAKKPWELVEMYADAAAKLVDQDEALEALHVVRDQCEEPSWQVRSGKPYARLVSLLQNDRKIADELSFLSRRMTQAKADELEALQVAYAAAAARGTTSPEVFARAAGLMR